MDKMVITMEQKQKVLDTFNANPSGCFIQVSGYENAFGEVATYQLQSGVNYGNIKDMSIMQLEDIKAGKEFDSLEVTCGVWMNPDGSITNRKAGGRTYTTIKTTYKVDEADFQKACDEVMEGLVNPRTVEQSYEKEAKGLYSIDEETLYIRNCLIVNKVVEKDGEYPDKATLPFNALKDKIRSLLKVSKYRTFKLESFSSIAINGTMVL